MRKTAGYQKKLANQSKGTLMKKEQKDNDPGSTNHNERKTQNHRRYDTKHGEIRIAIEEQINWKPTVKDLQRIILDPTTLMSRISWSQTLRKNHQHR